MAKEKKGYNGNDLIKPTNITIQWTKELLDEYTKCAIDPIYFIEKYIKIVNVDNGLVDFRLRDYQRNIIDVFERQRFVCLLAARQIGKSTVTIGFSLHQILFKSHYSVFVLAQDHKSSKDLLQKAKLAYENLPYWLQQGVEKMNENELKLENGSMIRSSATTKSGLRGRAANLLICDEFAFVGKAEEFYKATEPIISSGKTTKLFIISTPNGYNLFHKIWSGSNKDRKDENSVGMNGFFPLFVHWSQVPDRDEAWKEQTIARIGKDSFDQEHECKFESSGSGLIKADKIKQLMDSYINPISKDENFSIYENPIPGEKYVITVDTAKGIKKDYSAFSVIKISKTPYKQVAVYRSNEISLFVYPSIIVKIAKNYNDAHLLIENNEYGRQITTTIFNDLDYENILWTETINKRQEITYGNNGKVDIGIKTTSSTKNLGCANLKSIIEHDKLELYDYDTISELSTFIRKGNSFEADENCHDDLVITLVLFGWLTTQNYFNDLEQSVQGEIRDVHEEDLLKAFENIGLNNNYIEEKLNDDEDVKDFKEGWRRVKSTSNQYKVYGRNNLDEEDEENELSFLRNYFN